MRPQKENPLPVAKFCPIPGPFAVTQGHGGEVGVDDLGDFGGGEVVFAHLLSSHSWLGSGTKVKATRQSQPPTIPLP